MNLFIIIGLIFGYLIGIKIFPDIIYHGPNSNFIRKNIYYDSENDKFYKFTPKISYHPLNYF